MSIKGLQYTLYQIQLEQFTSFKETPPSPYTHAHKEYLDFVKGAECNIAASNFLLMMC